MRGVALSLGQNPDEISVGDGALMTRAAVAAGRAPSPATFFGSEPARPGGFSVETLPGGRVRTSVARTAEDFEMMVKSGWAVRGEASA